MTAALPYALLDIMRNKGINTSYDERFAVVLSMTLNDCLDYLQSLSIDNFSNLCLHKWSCERYGAIPSGRTHLWFMVKGSRLIVDFWFMVHFRIMVHDSRLVVISNT